MKNLKNILVGCLVLWQGISFCAAAQEARVSEKIPQVETLVCYNKGLRKDVQPLLVDGVLKPVSSGRFHKIENGRIEHVPLVDLENTFYLFEQSGIRDFECDVSVLQRVLFDYGVGGVTDPNPDGRAVYGDEYNRLIAMLRPKIEEKLNEQSPVAVADVDQRQAMLKSLPDEVTLKCTDGVIENIPVSFLVRSFEYFDVYFRNWGTGRFAYTGKEVVVDGTVQDMKFLLAYVLDCYRLWNPRYWDFGRGSGLDKISYLFTLSPTSYFSSAKLAHYLLLKKDALKDFLMHLPLCARHGRDL